MKLDASSQATIDRLCKRMVALEVHPEKIPLCLVESLLRGELLVVVWRKGKRGTDLFFTRPTKKPLDELWR